MADPRERELLLELKSGNLAAFEKILFAYENRILNYIYRFVSRKEDAEDLTQETFIRFYTNIHTVNPDDNFRGWLYRIATNIVFDWLRKEKRIRGKTFTPKNQEVNLEYLASLSAENYNIDAFKDFENVDEVKRAMRYLAPVHQSILILFYFDGFTQADIAKLWDIPLGTVKTRLRQARQEMKKTLLENNEKPTVAGDYGLSFSKN